jgi:hypothetical protein
MQLRLGVFVPRIPRGPFSDGHPMGHACTDLVSGAEPGAFCIPMAVLAATTTYQAALRRDRGEKDQAGMSRAFEDLPGALREPGDRRHRPDGRDTRAAHARRRP